MSLIEKVVCTVLTGSAAAAVVAAARPLIQAAEKVSTAAVAYANPENVEIFGVVSDMLGHLS